MVILLNLFNFFVVALFKYLIQNWMLQLSTNVHSSAFTVIQDSFCQRKNVNVLKIPLDAIVFKFYILYLLLLTPSHFCNGVTWKWHWMHWKSWQALSGWVSGSSTKSSRNYTAKSDSRTLLLSYLILCSWLLLSVFGSCLFFLLISYRTNQTNIFISVICKHNGFCNEKCCLFPFCHLDIKNNYSQPSRLISVAPSVFTTAGLSSTGLHSLNRAADQMAGDQYPVWWQ